MDTAFAALCFVRLIAVLNPVGALPIYLTLVTSKSEENRGLAVLATAVMLAALVVFMILGDKLLWSLGISLPAFRTMGGLLLLLTGISQLQGRLSTMEHTAEEAASLQARQTIAVVPMAIPILAGPGAISTVILLSSEAKEIPLMTGLCAALVGCAVVTLAVFVLADRFHQYLGEFGVTIGTRIMGLITSAMAVQFMADGLKQLFPVLAGVQTPPTG